MAQPAGLFDPAANCLIGYPERLSVNRVHINQGEGTYPSMELYTPIQRSTTLPEPKIGFTLMRLQNGVPSLR